MELLRKTKGTNCLISAKKKLTSGDLLEIAAQQSSSSGQGLDVETQILFTGQKV